MLITGILSILFSIVVFIGFILSLLALIFRIYVVKKIGRNELDIKVKGMSIDDYSDYSLKIKEISYS